MNVKERILREVQRKKVVQTSYLVPLLKISRQAVAKHCRELVAQGRLSRLNSTRNAQYVLARKNTKAIARVYSVKALEEDRVFRELEARLGLKQILSEEAYRIVNFAFTEMLNNAIEHSRASKVRTKLSCDGVCLNFEVLDRGIGVFENIRRSFKLASHYEAAEHLLKGRQTTAPKNHSGQGIFFTSKASDCFTLRSGELQLTVDNRVEDVFLEDISFEKGTRVSFQIQQRTKKKLKAVFDEYTNADFEFDKTKITVHLSANEGDYVSRSQAKRLLFGLDKFRRVVLDFKKVKGIGQGFADEVFRIYQRSRPTATIEAIRMSKAVEFMVRRATTY